MNNININNIFSVSHTNKILDVNSLYYPTENIIQTKIDFSIDSLINEREERKKKVIAQYKKTFHRCLIKIKIANKLNKTDIIFNIPDGVFMMPEYSMTECMSYLRQKLGCLYMETYVLSTKSLFITWINIENNRKNKK
jgi:hypothetical protein